MVRPLLQSMRPHQWVKNGFVLAPLIFSRNLATPALLWRALVAATLFCLASSAVYLINDLFDRERDRLHPVKRERPIASGRLSVPAAWSFAGLLVLVAIGGGWALALGFAGVVAGYMMLNLGYSLHLKHVVFVDVAIVASGFLLRVVGGGLAIRVPISLWLIVCTFLLSLYLALGKRKHELLTMGVGQNTRRVLDQYRLGHVKVAMAVASVITALSYAGYTFDPHTAEQFGTGWLPLTIPFIVIGLARFYRLTQSSDPASPTELMVKDLIFQVNILGWGIATVAIIYY